MIIFHEGVDGSGKTTHAKELATTEQNGMYIYNPVDWTKSNIFRQWLDFFEKYGTKDVEVHVDRSFLSNKPYRRWADKPEDFTFEQLDFLSRLPFSVIYYESGTEYEDATARGETNLKTKEDYDKIKKYYRELMRSLILKYKKKIFIYDWRHAETTREFNL